MINNANWGTKVLDQIAIDLERSFPEMNGYLHEKYNLPFIYLTAYDNTEIINRAIATTPYSYLTKPFKNVDLITSIAIAIRQAANLGEYKDKAKIPVKDGNYQVALPIEDINHIESAGNYLLFHTSKKTYKSRSTIKQIMETLPQSTFVQVHRAYVINKTKVEKADSKSVVVSGVVIPVSSQNKFHP